MSNTILEINPVSKETKIENCSSKTHFFKAALTASVIATFLFSLPIGLVFAALPYHSSNLLVAKVVVIITGADLAFASALGTLGALGALIMKKPVKPIATAAAAIGAAIPTLTLGGALSFHCGTLLMEGDLLRFGIFSGFLGGVIVASKNLSERIIEYFEKKEIPAG